VALGRDRDDATCAAAWPGGRSNRQTLWSQRLQRRCVSCNCTVYYEDRPESAVNRTHRVGSSKVVPIGSVTCMSLAAKVFVGVSRNGGTLYQEIEHSIFNFHDEVLNPISTCTSKCYKFFCRTLILKIESLHKKESQDRKIMASILSLHVSILTYLNADNPSYLHLYAKRKKSTSPPHLCRVD
jgi:hypothetical protein